MRTDDEPRRRRHWLAADAALAAFFVLLDTSVTLAGASWWPARPDTLAWVLLGVQATACASLAARRLAPFTIVAVLGGFTLLVTLLISPVGVLTPEPGAKLWAPFATVVAAFGPLFYRQGRSSRRSAYVALALLAAVVARPWEPSFTVIMIGVLRTTVGPLLGLYFDARRRLVTALTERAERAERERHLLAEQARTEERARLAGEMHDVVTHRVSLMALQAGALRMTARDEATAKAAEDLRAGSCQALEELRDLVGILRSAPEGDRTPSVEGLRMLAQESDAVGVPTEFTEVGDPELVSPVVGRTCYRIVREALTNVCKHAPGARVAVRIEYGRSRVRLTIRNGPPAGRPSSMLAGTGSGLGIAHLRQRIELVDGTLRAGRSEDGGFGVEAVLPAYVPTAEPAV
ncbi:histidine kinase [Streptomyces sp. WMMB303]|uniref:sensor histidine kinase n=1 Tax=Streptomyces sp. WMMB303 TaxID=3034154 RepID=UPI0023EACAE5|nr:histidine kinase [Streptomyces sp. WMMB303]MDF4252541.1 histidine kinase [Streptomyces sp. WMMB303]